ncbi:hypothetical protein JK158_21665 [Enterobacter sp. JGM127]|nr:hypothetical protein [Enterobacter sp. JGM127]
MSSDELNPYLNTHEKRVKKTFEELSTLINMATSMQEDIAKMKKEIRRLSFTIGGVIYVIFTLLFIVKNYSAGILDIDRFLQFFAITISFIIVFSAFFLYRIKIILREVKVERAAMQELMEVIFNLRKILPKHSVDLVDLTILDLKLKRLRFY